MLISGFIRKMYFDLKHFSQELKTRCPILLNKVECGTKPKLLGLTFKDTWCPSSTHFSSLSFRVSLTIPMFHPNTSTYTSPNSRAPQSLTPTSHNLPTSPSPRISHSEKILPSSRKYSLSRSHAEMILPPTFLFKSMVIE